MIIKLNSAKTELGIKKMFQILSRDILTWSASNLSLSLLFHLETFPKCGGEGVKLFIVIIKLTSAETELGNTNVSNTFP